MISGGNKFTIDQRNTNHFGRNLKKHLRNLQFKIKQILLKITKSVIFNFEEMIIIVTEI